MQGAQAFRSVLPTGPTGMHIDIFHRPRLENLLREVVARSSLNICTTIHRPNALKHLEKLFGRAPGGHIEERSDCSDKLELVIPGPLQAAGQGIGASQCGSPIRAIAAQEARVGAAAAAVAAAAAGGSNVLWFSSARRGRTSGRGSDQR